MRAVTRVNIYKYADCREYLLAIFRQRKQRNRRYSLRAYARDLRLSGGRLSDLLKGKSSVSVTRAEDLAKCLSLGAEEAAYFISLVAKDKKGLGAKAQQDLVKLRQEHAFTTLDSQIWPELSLKEFALVIAASLWEGIDADEKILDRLAMDVVEYQEACQRLEVLGWLRKSEDGRWIAPHGFIRSKGEDPSAGIRSFHRRLLETGLDQLENGKTDERFFYASLFSLSSKEYKAFCQQIEAFALQRSDSIGSRDKHDRIYALGLQLLPITGAFPSRKKRKYL